MTKAIMERTMRNEVLPFFCNYVMKNRREGHFERMVSGELYNIIRRHAKEILEKGLTLNNIDIIQVNMYTGYVERIVFKHATYDNYERRELVKDLNDICARFNYALDNRRNETEIDNIIQSISTYNINPSKVI